MKKTLFAALMIITLASCNSTSRYKIQLENGAYSTAYGQEELGYKYNQKVLLLPPLGGERDFYIDPTGKPIKDTIVRYDYEYEGKPKVRIIHYRVGTIISDL